MAVKIFLTILCFVLCVPEVKVENKIDQGQGEYLFQILLAVRA